MDLIHIFIGPIYVNDPSLTSYIRVSSLVATWINYFFRVLQTYRV